MAECLDKDVTKDKRPRGLCNWNNTLAEHWKEESTSLLRFSFFLSVPCHCLFWTALKKSFWSLGSAQWGWLLKETTLLFPHPWRFRTLTWRFPLQPCTCTTPRLCPLVLDTHSTLCDWVLMEPGKKYKGPILWKLQLKWSADPLMGGTGECFTLENRQMARKRG